MDSTDLEHAKREFKKRGSAFVIVKDEKVVAESEEKGVAPFFFAVSKWCGQLKGASLADKIVGKAIALLSAYGGIISVYTPLASDQAVRVLEEYSIQLEAEKVIPMILNRRKDDQCPIERLVFDSHTPEEAYSRLKKNFEG